MDYVVRSQRVRVGQRVEDVLVAAFTLEGGGSAFLQLVDQGELRRGGVYLLQAGCDEPALAPRFDELFADAAAKCRRAEASQALFPLLERAYALAQRVPPRLEPAELVELGEITQSAALLDRQLPQLPGRFSLEELVLATLLIFVSEEERYPRPRYRGCEVAWERFRSAVGPGAPL